MDLRDRLIHAATRYDMRQQSKRGYNRYAMAQYFSAIDDVVTLANEGMDPERAIDEFFTPGPLRNALIKAI